VEQARDDIGDLDAGIVQVVLDLDFVAEVTQRADEDIAEESIAQVADVGGLVGIDVRVLDDDLALPAWPGRGLREQSSRDVRTIDGRRQAAPRTPRCPLLRSSGTPGRKCRRTAAGDPSAGSR